MVDARSNENLPAYSVIMPAKPGESKEQQEAEAYMIARLSESVGVRVLPRRFVVAEGTWLEVDGASEDPPILCEAWAHIGRARSAQKDKVMADALKLAYLGQRLEWRCRKLLLFSDRAACAPFAGSSWRTQCLRHFEIDTEVIELPPELRERVLAAQKRQYR